MQNSHSISGRSESSSDTIHSLKCIGIFLLLKGPRIALTGEKTMVSPPTGNPQTSLLLCRKELHGGCLPSEASRLLLSAVWERDTCLGHCPCPGLDSSLRPESLEVPMFHLEKKKMSLSIYKREETFPLFIQEAPS